ncbi:hypothetical protein C8Q74DRAFT_1380831 [Fomes fomentarius]|nr:hypothetical protein C8Q74DRAFT_1380831 [Fomes fomentarius]
MFAGACHSTGHWEPALLAWQAPTFSNELEESKDISRDILLLTFVMTGCREGALTRSPPSKPPTLLNNLAFILNTSHPTRDPAGNCVVAITGHIDSEGIKMLFIMITVNHPVTPSHESEIAPNLGFSSKLVKPRNLKMAKSLLYEKAKIVLFLSLIAIPTKVDLEMHVQDILDVIHHCMAVPRTNMQGQHLCSVFIFSFIIHCCYPKLYARIANRKNIWGKHPIRIIHGWYHSDNVLSSLHPKTFNLPNVSVTQLASFDDLKATFLTVKKLHRSCPVLTPPATSIEATNNVMHAMGLLNALLVGDVGPGIPPEPGLRHKDVYIVNSSESQAEMLRSTTAQHPDISVIAYNSAHAIASLPARLKPGMGIQMSLITIDPPWPQVILNLVQALEDMVLMCTDEDSKPRICKLFSQVKEDVKGGTYGVKSIATLHAEAALMGVAYGTASGELHDNIVAETTMAGLSSTHHNWRKQQPNPGCYLDFVLPGTHSSIFPCIPLMIGIPLEVLKSMREKLIIVLQDVVCMGGGVKSTQRSPALSDAVLPGSPDLSELKSFINDQLGCKVE